MTLLPLIVAEVMLWLMLAGCVAFIVAYRPFSWRRHSTMGVHMLLMTYALGALAAVILTFRYWPFHLPTALWLQAIILAVLAFAVWQRVYLRWRSTREQAKTCDAAVRRIR